MHTSRKNLVTVLQEFCEILACRRLSALTYRCAYGYNMNELSSLLLVQQQQQAELLRKYLKKLLMFLYMT